MLEADNLSKSRHQNQTHVPAKMLEAEKWHLPDTRKMDAEIGKSRHQNDGSIGVANRWVSLVDAAKILESVFLLGEVVDGLPAKYRHHNQKDGSDSALEHST